MDNNKVNVSIEQCPKCINYLIKKPKCRVIKCLGYIVFYGKNGECTFFKEKKNKLRNEI